MLYLIFSLVLFIVIFPRVLLYVVSLLLISVCVLIVLVSTLRLRRLSGILMATVYLGAIIILVGYICAVTPNLLFDFSFLNFTTLTFFVFVCILESPYFSSIREFKVSYLLDYFFSPWGILIFITIVIMLFFVLLIVTSQYSLPQAPLRSL